MPAPGTSSLGRKPIAPLIVAVVIVVIAIVSGLLYLNRPAPKTAQEASASPEAKAYVRSLALNDVNMKASENFMRQQVVEITGQITNKGSRTLQSVDVYCLFYGVDGRQLYRERVPIVRSSAAPLKPNEARSFRLAFDSLPEGWNQAMPKMVIAQITFAQH
jgi:flagellar basal body-associated protein FliL